MKTTIPTRASRSSFTCNPKTGRCGNALQLENAGGGVPRKFQERRRGSLGAASRIQAHADRSEGLHAVLLYRSPEGILSEPRFCGFVRIPDDAETHEKDYERSRRTTMSNSGDDFPALYEFSTEARHSLRDTECFLVGRNPAANLILLDVSCSRQQFRIVRRDGQFVLEPLSATVPTRCNGQVASVPMLLRHEMLIEAGASRFRFLEHEPSAAKPAQLNGRPVPARPLPPRPSAAAMRTIVGRTYGWRGGGRSATAGGPFWADAHRPRSRTSSDCIAAHAGFPSTRTDRAATAGRVAQ